MSYILFKQWMKGNERAAFPVVYNYVYNKNKFDKIDHQDQQQQQQQQLNNYNNNNNNISKNIANTTSNDDDKYLSSSAASTPIYGKKSKKHKPSTNINDIDSDDDTVGIDSIDSTETITPDRDVIETPQQIRVDVHHHDNNNHHRSKVISNGLANNNTSAIQQRKFRDRGDNVKFDINHNDVVNNAANIDSGSESSDVCEIVNERRRQYQQRISLSSNSDSESAAYATVELRNAVSFGFFCKLVCVNIFF